MNRKNLTAAVLAGLAGAAGIVGSAQAVNINPDGLGQVLLYPYYTTNGGNTTVLSVVNTTDDAKAVKVRFMEGENSREVLDFNLYMSAWDVWTAALYDDDGTPTMITRDASCTVPYIYGNGGVQEFLPWALDDAEYLDKGPPPKNLQSKEYGDVSRGAEGHFEIIEMGTLVDDFTLNSKYVNKKVYPYCEEGSAVVYGNPSGGCTAPTGVPIDRDWTAAELAQPKTITTYGSASAVTHEDGVPADCQQLVDAWTENGDKVIDDDDGYWIYEAGNADVTAPSGGLFGGAAIINVQGGTMYSYDAKAIDGFASTVDAVDFLHQEPGTILPSLDSGDVTMGTVFDGGNTIDSVGLTRGVDAVSFVLMHDSIMNEYTTESVVGAGTEWVITFPTKQFYVHQAFLDDLAKFRGVGPYYETDDDDFIPNPPFTSSWTWVNTTYTYDEDTETYSVKKAGSVDYPCEVVQLDTVWDREERTPETPDTPPGTPIPPIVSPRPPGTTDIPDASPFFELCYETSVIQFGPEDDIGETTGILGSRNFHNIDNDALGFEFGWVRLDLYDGRYETVVKGVLTDMGDFRDDLGGLVGLPVAGFAVQRFENNFLGQGADVLANYGGIFQHKGTRSTCNVKTDRCSYLD